MKVLLLLFSLLFLLLLEVVGKFRPKLAWTTKPLWSSYELFQISHNYIKIAWK